MMDNVSQQTYPIAVSASSGNYAHALANTDQRRYAPFIVDYYFPMMYDLFPVESPPAVTRIIPCLRLIPMSAFSKRNKAILTGMFLSKFDKEGISLLGMENFTEAFNVLGYGLGVNPNSLKNYRDEFDPLFPNSRKGWRKRPMRDYCKKIHDEFSAHDLKSFSELIKSFLCNDSGVQEILDKAEGKDFSETVAKRLITGKAAEEYFKKAYQQEDAFKNCGLEDTTEMGCGFDFRLTCNSNFYCVEVKGLRGQHGTVSLTEKEFKVARAYKEQFCLFVVFNFVEKPYHKTYFDPLNSGKLQFKERPVTQLAYHSSVSGFAPC